MAKIDAHPLTKTHKHKSTYALLTQLVGGWQASHHDAASCYWYNDALSHQTTPCIIMHALKHLEASFKRLTLAQEMFCIAEQERMRFCFINMNAALTQRKQVPQTAPERPDQCKWKPAILQTVSIKKGQALISTTSTNKSKASKSFLQSECSLKLSDLPCLAIAPWEQSSLGIAPLPQKAWIRSDTEGHIVTVTPPNTMKHRYSEQACMACIPVSRHPTNLAWTKMPCSPLGC